MSIKHFLSASKSTPHHDYPLCCFNHTLYVISCSGSGKFIMATNFLLTDSRTSLVLNEFSSRSVSLRPTFTD